MNSSIDEPVEVREEEALDESKLISYLSGTMDWIQGDIEIRQFPGGFSNLTYLVSIGSKELVLRRPPFGKKAKTAHDMLREYRILKALKPVFPYCPAPLVYEEDESVIGAPFYLMERIKGIIIRKNFPQGLEMAPADKTRLCQNLVSVLCELHSIDYSEIGLGDFGKPEGYVERQVKGWSKRYREARTPDAPAFETVMEWLAKKMPKETGACVIHNDYKFDNVVLDPEDPLSIIGILDWEMATIGDPLMDLGASLAYWVDKNDSDNQKLMKQLPTTDEGMLTREEVIALYAEKTGRNLDNFDFYFCFGLFRLAVIAQQIYYRYYHGQTKDKRFAMLIFAVGILEESAKQVINKSRL